MLQTVRREVREELGVEFRDIVPLTADASLVTVRGARYRLLRVVYRGRCSSPFRLSADHGRACWFTLKEAIRIPRLVGGTRDILKALLQGEKNVSSFAYRSKRDRKVHDRSIHS